MIEVRALALVLQSATLFAILWIVLFWFWPSVRLDCFRQKMFQVRDELFDYAAAGKISFTHPAYRLLRQSMNGFIRYGHRVSFSQFLMTWLAWKMLEGSDSFRWEKRWRAALETLDPATRSDLVHFHERATSLVAERIVLGSPFLTLSLFVSAMAVLIHMGWKSASDLFTAAVSETAARAIDQRILDEEAARAA